MGVQFVIGRPGSGKSHYVYQEAIRKSREQDGEMIFIVPDQATFQTQQELLKLHPDHVLHHIEICGFTRLCFHIFQENVYTPPLVMDDIGKGMLLRKAAADVQSSLKVYGNSLDKSGFIEDVKSVLSELKQYKIDGPRLREMMEQGSGYSDILKAKFGDIASIMECFDRYMGDRYTTAEELFSYLAREIARNQKMGDRTLILDGFTGFTPIQYDVIEQMILHAKDVIIVLNARSEENLHRNTDRGLFDMSRAIYQAIGGICDRNGLVMKDPVVLDSAIGDPGNGRFRQAPALDLLERVYGNWGSHVDRDLDSYAGRLAADDRESICCHIYQDRSKEVEAVAVRIAGLLKQGYRYRDIGILVAGDREGYEPLIAQNFDRMNLAYFMDSKRPVTGNPLSRMLSFLLAIEAEDYSYTAVFAYLRCGFSGLAADRIDELANYCLATGKRGKSAWHKDWKRKVKGVAETEYDLTGINWVRTAFTEETDEVLSCLGRKKVTNHKKITALKKFLGKAKTKDAKHAISAEKKLEKMTEELRQEGRTWLVSEYEQVFEKITGLLDTFDSLLGDLCMDGETFRDVLMSGMDLVTVGLVPGSVDRLVIGDIRRSRMANPKILFILGMNDGVFPETERRSGIFNEQDRRRLAENQIQLAPDGRADIFIQDYYCYLAMTRPSEQLILSYVRSDTSGKPAKRSYYISRMLNQPQLKALIREAGDDVSLGLHAITGPEHDLAYLIGGLSEAGRNPAEDSLWKELYRWYQESGEDRWTRALDLMQQGYLYAYHEDGIMAETARALYGEDAQTSISRLESFAGCEFAHFITYGLKLMEQQVYGYDARDLGDIYHEVLDGTFRQMEERQIGWKQMKEDAGLRTGLIRELLDAAVDQVGREIFEEEENQQALVRMQDTLDVVLTVIAGQMALGSFRTAGTEVTFGMEEDGLKPIEIPLDCGLTLKIQGKIDRVDYSEYGSANLEIAGASGQADSANSEAGCKHAYYINVIDYKSGNVTFDPVKMNAGLQLQLVLYMEAAKKLLLQMDPEARIHWGGHYYQHLEDPMVEADLQAEDGKLEEAVMKALKLKGAANRSNDYIHHMERDLSGYSKVIAGIEYSVKNQDFTGRTTSAYPEKELEQMGEKCRGKAGELGERIYEGHALVNPYRYKNRRPCDYCKYQPICGFNPKLPGYGYRNLIRGKEEA